MSGASPHKCYACGGEVDADGMSEGGLVEETGSERTPPAMNAAGESTQSRQQKETDRNAEKRFARAVRGSR